MRTIEDAEKEIKLEGITTFRTSFINRKVPKVKNSKHRCIPH